MSWQLKAILKLFLCLWAEGRINCFPPFSGNEHLWISCVSSLVLHSSNVCIYAIGWHGQCILLCHWPMDTPLERFPYLSRKYLKQPNHFKYFPLCWKNHKMRGFLPLKEIVHFELVRHITASLCSWQRSPSPWSDTLHVAQGAQSPARCQN